jgi:putative transposase
VSLNLKFQGIVSACTPPASEPTSFENLPQSFTVFNLHKQRHKSFRTSNLIERFNQELKRRSKLVRIFSNKDSCLRLLSAVALEFHENWLDQRSLFNKHDLRH